MVMAICSEQHIEKLRKIIKHLLYSAGHWHSSDLMVVCLGLIPRTIIASISAVLSVHRQSGY